MLNLPSVLVTWRIFLMNDTATVQTILQRYGDEFLSKYPLNHDQMKAFNDILKCRTEACGLHTDVCENCGDVQTYYNSCGNRHCPQCQAVEREVWIHKEKYNTLDNIQYFHVVFTIPHELNILYLFDPVNCYNILFKASASALKKAAKNKKYLGADVGFTSVLHSWGSNMSLHPHIHMIVSGGGLSDGKWIESKKKFFVPVKALSKMFRAIYLKMLRKAEITLPNDWTHDRFYKLTQECYEKNWVVYTKEPFKDSFHVIKYLGRYTHRIAISNQRIVSCEDGKVTFTYKDYKDNEKIKEMTIDSIEFIRRFMLHVLPKGFMKIRHYGYLGNKNKKERLELCKELTQTPIVPYEKPNMIDILKLILKKDVSLCPACKMRRHHNLQ